MKGKYCIEVQIIAILKAHDVETMVSDLVREHGISMQGFYRWN